MCRLSSLSLTAAVVLTTLAAVPPARAGAGSDWRACNGRDVDDRIAACTRGSASTALALTGPEQSPASTRRPAT